MSWIRASDSGSFIIWGRLGQCDRRSALEHFHCILFFWTNGTRFSTVFMQLFMFRDLHFLFCVASSICNSGADLLNLYLHVMEVVGLEK